MRRQYAVTYHISGGYTKYRIGASFAKWTLLWRNGGPETDHISSHHERHKLFERHEILRIFWN